jgi:hypothetical protein
MATSMDKAANAIARIHIATHIAASQPGSSAQLVAINDGIFISSQNKKELCQIIRSTLMLLAGRFISKHDPQDRFLARCAIAFGPTFSGQRLADQLMGAQKRKPPATLQQVIFGSPVIQAYQAERHAPPYGVFVHESARAFAPNGERPFRSTLWRWWQPDDGGGISGAVRGSPSALKNVLNAELDHYFRYMDATLPFHAVDKADVERWRTLAKQYFAGYANS